MNKILCIVATVVLLVVAFYAWASYKAVEQSIQVDQLYQPGTVLHQYELNHAYDIGAIE